jgi:hypothetical protein
MFLFVSDKNLPNNGNKLQHLSECKEEKHLSFVKSQNQSDNWVNISQRPSDKIQNPYAPSQAKDFMASDDPIEVPAPLQGPPQNLINPTQQMVTRSMVK